MYVYYNKKGHQMVTSFQSGRQDLNLHAIGVAPGHVCYRAADR